MRKTWISKRVEIKWHDITVDVNTDQPLCPEPSTTVGWVEYQDKKYIRVVTTKYKSLDIADKIAIPMGCIESIKEI